MIGRDSPGVGAYAYDFNKLSKSVLSYGGPGGKAGGAFIDKNYSFGTS